MRRCQVASPPLEAALFAWIRNQANRRQNTSGPITKAKETRVQEAANRTLPQRNCTVQS